MKRNIVTTATLTIAATILIGIPLITNTPAQLEQLAAPEAPRVTATHLDVNNTTMVLHVPLTDPNGVAASSGAVNIRINKNDLDGLTTQQKLKLRDVVVKLLQLKGFVASP